MPAIPPRPVDATLHGVVDYNAGAMLTTVLPKLLKVEGTPAARQIRTAGAVHLAYSAITSYPLGIVKVLPFKAHLALDAVGALALAAAPFVTGQYKSGRRQWLPQLAISLFELGSLGITDPPGKGEFHGDFEATRAANQEAPHRKI